MEVKEIKLKDSMPDTLTIELSVMELAQIAWWLGNIPAKDIPKGLEGFYSEAVGTIFNTFWYNGLRGCIDGDDE